MHAGLAPPRASMRLQAMLSCRRINAILQGADRSSSHLRAAAGQQQRLDQPVQEPVTLHVSMLVQVAVTWPPVVVVASQASGQHRSKGQSGIRQGQEERFKRINVQIALIAAAAGCCETQGSRPCKGLWFCAVFWQSWATCVYTHLLCRQWWSPLEMCTVLRLVSRHLHWLAGLGGWRRRSLQPGAAQFKQY
jgi:hypothetical protein